MTAHMSAIEHTIARFDEEEIENDLRRAIARKDDDGFVLCIYVEALRLIDEMQANGTYKREREALRAKADAEHATLKNDPKFAAMLAIADSAEGTARMARVDAAWRQLMAGLKSPDPEQRGRFEILFATIQNKTLFDAGVIAALDVAEKAKRAKGAKAGSQYPGDAVLLVEMKALVRGGLKVASAALAVAPRAGGRGNNTLPKSKAKRLETAFHAKMALRLVAVEE